MSSSPIEIKGEEDINSFLGNYDSILFDCDGVIWLDNELIPGVLETLNYLRSIGKKFAFVTNNSSKSRKLYLEKFIQLGVEGLTINDIFPTCFAAGKELENLNVAKGSKVWVFGDDGIEEELREIGYKTIGGTDERLNEPFDPEHDLLKVDPEVKAVVVGSTKELGFLKISSSLQYLLNKDVKFIGANVDRTYPGPKGLVLPAGGSVVNYMAFTSNREPIIVGKPSKDFLEIIIETTKFKKERTLMVGDTLYTDIKFGNVGGLAGTLLVLTGGTNLEELHETVINGEKSAIPKHYITSLGDIHNLVK